MKDIFTEDYHAYRAAQEDHAKRMTAALIDYAEDTSSKLEEIAERHDISISAISIFAKKFVREEYHRKRGPLPNPKAMSENKREIIYRLRAGGKPKEVAKELNLSIQYVYEVQAWGKTQETTK